MLLFAAAAACAVGIHQRIVGNIGFVAAIAAAVPYYKALCIPLICGIKRSEPAETVTRDVRKGVSAPVEASAARFPAACKLGSACFAFAAAFAAATPESVAQLAFAQNGKPAEHTACQIVRYALPDTFVPQAATALRIPASERTFEHIPFRAAIAAAKKPAFALCVPGILPGGCPPAEPLPRKRAVRKAICRRGDPRLAFPRGQPFNTGFLYLSVVAAVPRRVALRLAGNRVFHCRFSCFQCLRLR